MRSRLLMRDVTNRVLQLVGSGNEKQLHRFTPCRNVGGDIEKEYAHKIKDVDVDGKVSLVWIVGGFHSKVVETFAMFRLHNDLHASSNLVTYLAALRELWKRG